MDFHWGLNACSQAHTGGKPGKIHTAIFRAMNLTHPPQQLSSGLCRDRAKQPSCCNFPSAVSLGFRVGESSSAFLFAYKNSHNHHHHHRRDCCCSSSSYLCFVGGHTKSDKEFASNMGCDETFSGRPLTAGVAMMNERLKVGKYKYCCGWNVSQSASCVCRRRHYHETRRRTK